MVTRRHWNWIASASLWIATCAPAAWGQAARPNASQAPRVGIFLQSSWGEDRLPISHGAINRELQRRGMTCIEFHEEEFLAGRGISGDSRCDVLIVPTCYFFPADGVEPLLDYLKSGGRMILVGGRRFADWTVKHKDVWTSQWWLDRERREMPAQKLLAAFSEQERTRWHRSSGSPGVPTRISTEPLRTGATGRALRVDVADFSTWDVVTRRFEQSPLPDDANVLTCFWAKGSKDLPQISIEWEEKDGSRWVAVVELTTQWKHYALAPRDFLYWQDSTSRGRGGAGDRLRPANLRRLAFGVAKSHTSKVPDGAHSYWIADVGWAIDPFPALNVKPPVLETISPWYKTYEIDLPATLQSVPGQALLPAGLRWKTPDHIGPPPILGDRIVSPVARTTGAGFVEARAYRWIPLVSVVDEKGTERGTAASMLVWRRGVYARSAWGYIGVSFGSRTESMIADWIGAMAEYLARGVWFAQGGTQQQTYAAGTPWRVKAEILNRSASPVDAGVGLTIRQIHAGGPTARTGAFQPPKVGVTVNPGASTTVDLPLFTTRNPGFYRLFLDLSVGDRRIDSIEQEVFVAPRGQMPDPQRLVRVKDGDFVVGGKPWVPFGVNFWPLSATGLEANEYWLHWLSPDFYDPVRTQRDLERVRDYGMNVICVQYHNESQAPALIDLLERCRALDLRAFIYLPGGHPLRPNPARLQQLIRAARLAESDAVFAYDVAWEPHVGDEGQRRRLDPMWHAWIVERYGGIENAEKDWGVAAPRDDQGRVTGPSRKQILEDGPHRVMVAAYRRFLDDTISQGYGVVRRAIREVDPHHLIGARSGYGGTGNAWGDDQIPFDLASGVKHLDFISPEGYGHGPSWETVRNAGLTTLYGRLVGGGKPVWWAEYGMSVHPQPDDKALALQGEMYANFARMIVESRANGGAGWWFPGGFRLGENSDYGIFNPDGTPRPAALANREWAGRIAAIRAPKRKTKDKRRKNEIGKKADVRDADTVIVVDRDLHPRGYSQIRARHESEYLAAVEAGKRVALATEATGTHSANVPLVAVGNRPYTGNNPPKYLNAEFERFWVKVGDGEWREVKNGERIVVGRGDGRAPQGDEGRSARVDNPRHVRVLGRAQVANTGQAAWLPPDDPRAAKGGGVYLVSVKGKSEKANVNERSSGTMRSAGENDPTIHVPLTKVIPALGDCVFEDFELVRSSEEDLTIELELEAAGRARFGQRWRLNVRAR